VSALETLKIESVLVCMANMLVGTRRFAVVNFTQQQSLKVWLTE